jgi:hypothetical protein
MASFDESHPMASIVQLDGTAGEKLQLAQYFIRCYSASRQGLTQRGILRSERSLQGDYAEWLVAELLGLQLAPSGVQKGYDAIDVRGSKYQVKSRVVKSLLERTSFDFRSLDANFDHLACVFLSPLLDVLGILRVPYAAVCDHASTNRNSCRFRWNKATERDPRIEKLIWPDPE